MRQEFNIPSDAEKVYVEEKDGKIVIDWVKKAFKAGDVLVNEYENNRKIIFIPQNDFIEMPNMLDCHFAMGMSDELFMNTVIGSNEYKLTRYATTEERKQLVDRIEAKGYEYNHETMKLEKKRWTPKIGELYFSPFIITGSGIWFEDYADIHRFKMNAVFKTKAESDAAAEKIKQVLANN